MNLVEEYKKNIYTVLEQIELNENEAIEAAATVIADTVEAGGIIQAFGSGHSFAGAIEIAGRAGGYIPSKAISNFYGINGWLETVSGVGEAFIKQVDIDHRDCFVIISNSGRNPLHVEFSKYVTGLGCKLIVMTNTPDARKNAESGDSILNYADVVLNNNGYSGDCSIALDELGVKVAPTSSIAVAHIASMMTLRSVEILCDRGVNPPIYKSANIDGGREYNHELRKKYQNRLNRV